MGSAPGRRPQWLVHPRTGTWRWWSGHQWTQYSEPHPVPGQRRPVLPPFLSVPVLVFLLLDVGVYRIATRPSGPLDHLGQGLIARRWRSHADGWVTDLAAERADETAWGWVPLEIGARQLLEVENDLIASHMVMFARPPVAQFGRSGD